jgi:hypothetical protein
LDGDKGDKILIPEHLIHYRPHSVYVFITDLYEDRAGIGKKLAGDLEPIAKIGQV